MSPPRVLHPTELAAIKSKTLPMSSRQRKGKVTTANKSPKQKPSPQGVTSTHSLNEALGTTSSMDNVRIQPRTPRQGVHDTEEVELTLLEEDEQRQAAIGVLDDDDSVRASRHKHPMSTKDKRAMGLLITLCQFTCRYRVNIAKSY